MHKKSRNQTNTAGEAILHFTRHRHPDTSHMWVLVADKARARLFELLPGDSRLSEIACFDNPDAKVHGTARDRLPRSRESAGNARHAIEPHTTLEEKSVDRFARTLNQELDSRRIEHRYDKLILVAPPRFLGALRQCFDEPLRNCVAAEVAGDLTTWPAKDIFEHLSPPPVAQ